MSQFRKRLVENLSKKSIRDQMYEIYYLAILLPEIIIGGILTVYVYFYYYLPDFVTAICLGFIFGFSFWGICFNLT